MVERLAPEILLVRVAIHAKLLLGLRPLLFRSICAGLEVPGHGKDPIERHFESIIKHPGQQLSQELTRLFKARVRVDFDQPRLVVLVDHKIVAKNLETKLAIVLVEFESCRRRANLDNW